MNKTFSLSEAIEKIDKIKEEYPRLYQMAKKTDDFIQESHDKDFINALRGKTNTNVFFINRGVLSQIVHIFTRGLSYDEWEIFSKRHHFLPYEGSMSHMSGEFTLEMFKEIELYLFEAIADVKKENNYD